MILNNFVKLIRDFKVENNLIQNIIKELQNKGKIERKEELEELITNLHRINNDIVEIKNKNEELNNCFGLFWKEVPEKLIKKISDNEVVYGKSVYYFVAKIKNGEGKTIKANINKIEIKLNRQADSYLFKDSEDKEFLVFSDSIYTLITETEEEYIPVLKEKGKDFFIGKNEDNILIEGDNYYALQILQYTHKEKIDVIYIDPPYNTGNKDFKYNDKFVKEEDGDRHSSWLSFMNKRLELAKNLMSNESVIFISIDYNENHRLRLLCDKVFGENNFISEMPRKTVSHIRKSADYEIQNINDIVLLYAKNKSNVVLNKKIIGQKEYKLNDKKGYYTLKPFQNSGENGTREARPNLYYPIYYNEKIEKIQLEKEEGFIEILPQLVGGKEGRWLWSKSKFINDNHMLCVVKGIIKRKCYFDDTEDQNVYQVEKNWLEDFHNRNGALELKKLGLGNKFSYPKPIDLIKFLINLISKKESVILDFFAGSATTGHSVWDLNKKDNGNRKFILCTNNENNICEDIAFERLKRANEKYEYNESLKYLLIQHISEKKLRKEDYKLQFETLKQIINLKYNSFKIVEENDNWFANENIAILKNFDYIEEFKLKFLNYNFLGIVTNEDAEWNIFKKNLLSVKRIESLVQFSSSYMNEIRKVIKG